MNRVQRVLERFRISVEDKGGDRRSYGACPFHAEGEKRKYDNWFIRLRGERRGQYHCFVCKESGGLADLVRHVRGCTLARALEWLDELSTEPDEEPVHRYETIRMEVESIGSRGFRYPTEVRVEPLERWVTPARRYAEARHLTAQQVARWGMGYAAHGRLAGRLVMPVRDAGSRPCSYMARTFTDHPTRYLYPSTKEAPDLDCAFGEEFWPDDDGPREKAVIVVTEGALNALAVERAMGGAVAVVALGGSDPRPMHVLKISSFGRVLILTDDDPAGRGAAWELKNQLARHTAVGRVTVGIGRDADDVSREELRETICRGIG
jgi:DNA primase